MTEKRRVTGYIPIDVHERLKTFADSHYPKLSESTAVALLLSIALDPDRSTAPVPAGDTTATDESLANRIDAIEATLKKLSCDVITQNDTNKKIEAIETTLDGLSCHVMTQNDTDKRLETLEARLEEVTKTLLELQEEASIASQIREPQPDLKSGDGDRSDVLPEGSAKTAEPLPRLEQEPLDEGSIDDGGVSVGKGITGKDLAAVIGVDPAVISRRKKKGVFPQGWEYREKEKLWFPQQ